MNEEEKKAIERLKERVRIDRQLRDKVESDFDKFCEDECLAIETVLNLIDKQNKVIDEKEQEIEYLNCIIESDKDNYISKDKIREKIEELDIEIQQCEYADDDIEEYKNDMEKEKSRLLRDRKILQELLEEDNGEQM